MGRLKKKILLSSTGFRSEMNNKFKNPKEIHTKSFNKLYECLARKTAKSPPVVGGLGMEGRNMVDGIT